MAGGIDPETAAKGFETIISSPLARIVDAERPLSLNSVSKRRRLLSAKAVYVCAVTSGLSQGKR
jgi:hypothetical protein